MLPEGTPPQGFGGDMGGGAAVSSIGKPPEKKALPIKLILLGIVITAAVAFFALGGGASIGGKEGKSSSHGSAQAYYFAIPEISVNLGGKKENEKVLKLRVNLQVGSDADKLKAEELSPQIIDQFQSYLRGVSINDLKGSEGLYRAKEELLMRANVVTNPLYVEDVLFQQLLIQ
ncbi:MAG: flagellar basal body-associated FliL family protein [Alphaproteobacteria bacterium]